MGLIIIYQGKAVSTNNNTNLPASSEVHKSHKVYRRVRHLYFNMTKSSYYIFVFSNYSTAVISFSVFLRDGGALSRGVSQRVDVVTQAERVIVI